jgi:hypothetical protein
MTPTVKFLIGLAAVLAMGWMSHGPLGQGEALLARLEAEAQAGIDATGVPVRVRMQRDPMARVAVLSGRADAFQREGQGSLKGVNDIVRETDGVAGLRWADGSAAPDGGGRSLPLLAEFLVPLVLAYLIGAGIAWFLFGRPRREGFY